jgi:hypothetical protein
VRRRLAKGTADRRDVRLSHRITNIDLDQYLVVSGTSHIVRMGRHIIFKCPQTGLNVQHWLEDIPDDAKSTYTPVTCQACTRLHLIHNSTGKLSGEADE